MSQSLIDHLSSYAHYMSNLGYPDIPLRYLRPLAILGGLWATSRLLSTSSWIWLHLLRPSSLSKYKNKSGESWALVTGASDGIGRALSEELAQRGFDVILHGRTKTKLDRVRGELQELYPGRKFRVMILDAELGARDTSLIDAALKEIKDLDLKILINNAAGGGSTETPVFSLMHERPVENVDSWNDVCMAFPVHLTRAALPQLIKNQPALVLNISSAASVLPMSYMQIYSGAKSYLNAWTRGLQGEAHAQGNDLEFKSIIVGQVSTPQSKRQPSLLSPNAETMARSTLNVVGSTRTLVAAYWPHSLQQNFTSLLSDAAMGKNIADTMKEMGVKEKKGVRSW